MRTTLAALFVAATALLATPHVLARAFAPDPDQWLTALTAPWSAPGEAASFTQQRDLNPEYDLMARTFTVLALADRALATPEEATAHLAAMDAILTDTLARTEDRGHAHWLLPYAGARPWRGDGSSLFVDGELLVMLGARRMVRDDRDDWRAAFGRQADRVVARFGAAGPLALAESYPDEGWTFCHSVALLGLRMEEVLDGADHSATREAFLDVARGPLTDPETGLLISSFSMDGRPADGPEGSTLWLSAIALQVSDPRLARAQYVRARAALGRDLLGLGYAREWPEGAQGRADVDSGPIVPLLDASASSSGLALAAAKAFDDPTWHRQLTGALGAAEALLAVHPVLAQSADTPVGRAVLVWGLGFGPLFDALGAPVG